MSDKRLWTEHQTRVEKLAHQINEDRQALREAVGFGGVELKPEEVKQRYVERGVEGHLQLLLDFQAQHPTWGPTEVSKKWLRYQTEMFSRIQRQAT